MRILAMTDLTSTSFTLTWLSLDKRLNNVRVDTSLLLELAVYTVFFFVHPCAHAAAMIFALRHRQKWVFLMSTKTAAKF